jgi:DinB family protein
MDAQTRADLIAKYEAGYGEVEAALAGASAEELEAREGPTEWSAREIVHHLADSEMTSAIRLRRLLAEDDPLIAGYDEEEFARRLHYDRPLEGSLVAFKGARDSTAPLLRALSEDEWARAGTHSESGEYSVETWLRIYASHGFDHADQIRRARGAAKRD